MVDRQTEKKNYVHSSVHPESLSVRSLVRSFCSELFNFLTLFTSYIQRTYSIPYQTNTIHRVLYTHSLKPWSKQRDTGKLKT